ncbi:unnamed protein product [Sympodiomycopsis kandeliae]
MTEAEYTLVSSPGKVLLAGGYLVLSPAYPGLVIATDSRFYSLVRPCTTQQDTDWVNITIHSPQFVQATWQFSLNIKTWESVLSQQSAQSPFAGKSPFLYLSLIYALGIAIQHHKDDLDALRSVLKTGLDVHILADNDFYSQRKGETPPTSSYLTSLPPFNPLGVPISKVHKTGLGSSAALTTSLVSALLIHFKVNPSLAFLHNASQLAHCAAQGKVGSGFDVSSATWGSQIFRRFDPNAIKGLLADIPSIAIKDVDTEATKLESLPDLLTPLDPSNALWQPSPLSAAASTPSEEERGAHPTAFEGLHSVQPHSSSSNSHRPAPLQLPPRISLLLVDVDAGSNTPSLVGKVNDWKARKPEWAQQLYSVLASSNQSLADSLLSLQLAYDTDQEKYHQILDQASSQISKSWPAPSPSDDPTSAMTHLVSSRNALRSIRAGMRELGKLSGAPIEPDEMGRLIQSVIDGTEGIVGGGVPGAGGYDALYLLYISPRDQADKPRQAIEDLLIQTKEAKLSVGVLLSQAGQSKRSDSITASGRDNDGGLRVEKIDKVKGLQDRLTL